MTTDPHAIVVSPEQAKRGCSLGNIDCFLRADAQANVDGLWLAANNRWYCGELSLHIAQPEGFELVEVEYASDRQVARYQDTQGATIEKRLGILPANAYCGIRVTGEGFAPGTQVEVVCQWRIGAARSDIHRQQPHWQDCERRWKIVDSFPPSYITAQPEDDDFIECALFGHSPIRITPSEPGRVICHYLIPADASGRLFFSVGLSLDRRKRTKPGTEQAHKATEEEAWIETTPTGNTLIDRAVHWGKAGSQRVWHRYGTGDWGFTNDPPGNTIVTRDAAWFIYGADHFAPHWSRALLDTITRHAVYPDGKIAEFVRLSPEKVERDDYRLNLNDATPLYILGVAHHWRATQDRSVLEAFTPAVCGAADWILQQRNADGLIWCDGRDTNVWGIGGWRNIIPGYRLAGALTELNAECVAALRAASALADAAADAERAARYGEAAAQLDAAMGQLVDPQTGYFYLTRDENGPNRQIAIDLVFPALFQAGPEEARVRTLLRLTEPDFQHPFGLRALGKNDPAYHPRFGWGLMGGSWPNATAWAAAALFPIQPDLAWELAERLARSLFPEFWTAPGVSVPGQFPEWFDGDTGESSGMSLSPWMPATYVWLIEEALRA